MTRTDCVARLLLIGVLAGCQACSDTALGEPGECADAGDCSDASDRNDAGDCSDAGDCNDAGGCNDASDCDDGVDCTDDACGGGDCSHTPNDVNCDNGLFCDGAETCQAGDGCQAGVAPTNDDSVSCTEDVCDEETDGLINSPFSFSNVRVVDASGTSTTSAVLGTQVQVAADLGESCGTEAAFTYVVEFVDPVGEREFVWITGMLGAGQSFSPSLSWVPEARGEHRVIASIRQKDDNTMPEAWPLLTRQLSVVVDVE